MQHRSRIILPIVLLLGFTPLLAGDDGDFEGSVELLYRDVDLDGSSRKYEEDFDDLDSGLRLGNLSVHWLPGDQKLLDHARLEASGLGGDPFQRSWFRMGRKDVYDLSIRYTEQEYVYNLFEVVDDLDGAAWDSERRAADVNLTLHANETTDVILRYQKGEREGSSLFMKYIERDLFRLETPLDQTSERFTVGVNSRLGPVNFFFRHTFRDYDNQFNNRTADDSGLTDDLATLTSYDWRQDDSGESDWTTLKLSGSGGRVDYTVALFGTFFGDDEVESRVRLNAEGTSFEGVCSASAVVCESDDDCEPISGVPGDTCVANPFSVTDGFNDTDLEGDSTLVDVEVSIAIASPLDLHLQYRDLDRDLEGKSEQDLDGDGASVMVETRHDYAVNTTAAILEYRPIRQVELRAGYRLIDRELDRTGFVGLRNVDYESDNDDTLILGVKLKPVDWFRLSADFEDGDITQPFNAVAPQERDHTRVRATFTPRSEMRIDLSFLDYENRNTATDLRDPGSRWDGSLDGTNWSASFWHRPSDHLDYLFRYSEQDVESEVGVAFDQDDFGAIETGDSIFNNNNSQFSGQINFRWADAWKAFARVWFAESDGNNVLLGDGDVGAGLDPGVRNDAIVDQEFENAEVGLTYTFERGIFVGASYWDFDYDDVNDLMDYDGGIFTVRLGTTF